VLDVAHSYTETLAVSSATGNLGNAGFSPDGDKVLFSQMDANDNGLGLWSANVDSSGVQEIVAGDAWGQWQPVVTSAP
jgi:Tol biopolymer transport system component